MYYTYNGGKIHPFFTREDAVKHIRKDQRNPSQTLNLTVSIDDMETYNILDGIEDYDKLHLKIVREDLVRLRDEHYDMFLILCLVRGMIQSQPEWLGFSKISRAYTCFTMLLWHAFGDFGGRGVEYMAQSGNNAPFIHRFTHYFSELEREGFVMKSHIRNPMVPKGVYTCDLFNVEDYMDDATFNVYTEFMRVVDDKQHVESVIWHYYNMMKE